MTRRLFTQMLAALPGLALAGLRQVGIWPWPRPEPRGLRVTVGDPTSDLDCSTARVIDLDTGEDLAKKHLIVHANEETQLLRIYCPKTVTHRPGVRRLTDCAGCRAAEARGRDHMVEISARFRLEGEPLR